MIGTDFSVGMTVSFECLPGYSLMGDASLTCNHGISRNWNHALPRCEGKTDATLGTHYDVRRLVFHLFTARWEVPLPVLVTSLLLEVHGTTMYPDAKQKLNKYIRW